MDWISTLFLKDNWTVLLPTFQSIQEDWNPTLFLVLKSGLDSYFVSRSEKLSSISSYDKYTGILFLGLKSGLYSCIVLYCTVLYCTVLLVLDLKSYLLLLVMTSRLESYF